MTGGTELQSAAGRPGSGFLWRIASLIALAGGTLMIATGLGTVPAAILLMVVGLAAAGVLLGGARYGPATEGVLDLGARLGLGLLGGALGGLLALVVRSALVELGVAGALGVDLPTVASGSLLLSHMGGAAVWGMVLGIVYPHVPGASPAGRGALFSLVPSLYVLLKVYPFDRDLGWFGVELGWLTGAFVIGLNLLWGAVAGASIGWGETAEGAPVSRPIGD